ncbi:MAG: UDP-N-acetylglucosamine 2-epimerase (non-hydrolyzing) [Endomicrobia bacterium]|nr:UDP-N-acetylglucosamine 2-epimerase (non-hydrolyzing) [Endomicrobiia bacterium]
MRDKKNILFVFGTRPEAIKLAPVILEMKKYPALYNVTICNTEQQKELSNQTLSFFGLKADINLNVMTFNQTLAALQSKILKKLSEIFQKNKFDAVIVQGDTMSIFCGALAAFYNKVPVFHVEAGLRSYNMAEPFPEEAIRQMVSKITDLHFAPTQLSYRALLDEKIPPDKIFITGNTVVDALFYLPENVMLEAEGFWSRLSIRPSNDIVLITAHRRENHGARMEEILSSIKELADKFKKHKFVIPVHPNPNVKKKVLGALSGKNNILITEPLDYPHLVWIMKNSKLILTDSGGIQEEAPAFGVPTLVMRYETERKEGIELGLAKLVGTDRAVIVRESEMYLAKDKLSVRTDSSKNPYGDGHAAEYILRSIREYFKGNII